MSDNTKCQHTQPCVCWLAEQQTVNARFVLLLHPNEPFRPSNTAGLIRQVIPATDCFVWHRKTPPQALLHLLQDPNYRPWLIFPADRPELAQRSKPWQQNNDGRTDLFLIPDGTWKEVRKMVRQSPWLAELDILAFQPEQTTKYKLRRNPDLDHLCTAEIACQLLTLISEQPASAALSQHFERFLQQYHAWQHHQPRPYLPPKSTTS